MEIICSQSALKDALNIVSRAVPSRPTHPILANVLMVVTGDKVTLTGFDLSLGITTTFDAQVMEEGKITLPAKLFSDIINKSPEGDIAIEFEDEEDNPMVEIKSSSGKFNLRGVVADEYPELPEVEKENSFELPALPLAEGLKGTLFASSTDEGKQVLTGIHIKAKDNILEFASTDGHRLAVVKPNLEEQEVTEFQLTIPNKPLREVLSILGTEAVTINYADNQLLFAVGNTRIFSRSLDGTYPNYHQLIPNNFERTFVTNRKEFIEAVERMSVFTDQKNTMIKCSIFKQQIVISADAKELGNAKATVKAETTGDPLDIGFNIKYLLEGLKVMSSNEVKFSLNSATQPVIATPLSGQQMTYLIMPVNIRE
jgi:DNA polymerase-3 subunit beta